MEGATFGRYRLVELLGCGGMGEVWRACDTATNGRFVAIKLLPPQLAVDPTFVQRFRREADAVARLNNPHIIPIHSYGEIDGRLYVDMRLVEGRDLQAVLADGPLDPVRAARIIGQVANALHAAHKVGLVHRDVKPSNILLDEGDFAYLIDFGIVQAADETQLTGTGSVIGSFCYMSPERLQAGQVDARSDVYALACVLYECLTGSAPFPGDSAEQQITAHVMSPPPRPSTSQPNIPEQVDQVIAIGMAKDPGQRYATAVELADALDDAITTPLAPPGESNQPGDSHLAANEQLPPAGRPSPDGPTLQRRRWWRRQAIVVPAALLTAAVIAAVIVITGQQHKNSGAAQITSPSGPHHREPAHGSQVTLPFSGLDHPVGVAVDAAGDLFVADGGKNRVLKLATGSSTPKALQFAGPSTPRGVQKPTPRGVAADSAGDLYVADDSNDRVVELAANSSIQTVLPFTGLNGPTGVAVDIAGNRYVADSGNNRVVELAAGSSTPNVLPFTGLSGPGGVAVDAVGNVCVTDYMNNRVLKLAAGSSTPTVLPFTGLNGPYGVALDAADDVYVTDAANNRVVELAAGSSTQVVLPFAGLFHPYGVAVDAAGNVYATDWGSNRVLKLLAT
jgi:serine/threonine protein kinase, bacterial